MKKKVNFISAFITNYLVLDADTLEARFSKFQANFHLFMS